MYQYMFDESIQICDDPIDSIASLQRKTVDELNHQFSNSEDSEGIKRLNDYRRKIMSNLGEGNGDDGGNPSGQGFQEKFERPITRVGSRQKTATQQPPPPSGRPGTGTTRNASSVSRPRPPSPEPSEAADAQSDDDDDEDEYDALNNPQVEGNYKLLDMTRNESNHNSSTSSSDDVEISVDESLRELLQMADYTDMSCKEFTKLLNMFPENVDLAPPDDDYLKPCSDEEKEVQNVLDKKRWVELVLEQKREVLRIDARMSSNPGIHGIRSKGMYNAEDYINLNTTPEIKQLFDYITKYLPSANMTPEVKFKPFIREYEASVGDIDAFIKVLHPDITNDGLGIKVLDEPSAFQSDPSVLDLRLRAMAKQSSAKAIVVKKVENAHKNSKIIDNWIKDISDLHRSKPSPSVHYSKPMPDIDLLLQEWPPEFEELLKNATHPSANLDCDLKTYVDLVCNLLDIPVYKSRIQSLHVLATLYATHKNFNTYGPTFGGNISSGGETYRAGPRSSNSFGQEENVDRMEL